ncbi:hypothetical protein MIU24_32355 [Streptomyces venezuelae]|uniref:hypothetical protein n=1 Tax=Streptomyces sp. B6(2022) TaxID=3404749 RepID=UPI00311D3A9F
MPKPSLIGRLTAATHNAGVRTAGAKGAKIAAAVTNTLLGSQVAECGPTCGDHCAGAEHFDVLSRTK